MTPIPPSFARPVHVHIRRSTTPAVSTYCLQTVLAQRFPLRNAHLCSAQGKPCGLHDPSDLCNALPVLAGCSPGYFPPENNPEACKPCGKGGYCPGGLVSPAGRISCGTLLTTSSATASDATACVTLPGVAYMQGPGTATKCSAGAYSKGGNQRNCTDCPYDLTTADVGATDVADCSALLATFTG